MTNYNRISSIDVMRGIVLFLMLFFNYPGADSVPPWIRADISPGGISGPACWIFPAFLFLAGMSIPFSFSARISRGESQTEISRHIFVRFICLLIIGILILNTMRVDEEFTGMKGDLWSVAMFAGIFLVWNDYPGKKDNFFTITGLKLLGMAILTFLVFKFQSGLAENNGSLSTGWWGFAGLIGWGYLISAFIYLFFRNSSAIIIFFTLLFLLLNILSDLQMIVLPDPARSFLRVITEGQAPFVALTGLIAGLLLKNFSMTYPGRAVTGLSAMMIVFISAGLLIMKMNLLPDEGTTAITLLSSGLCLVLFIPVYFVTDIRKLIGWAGFLRPAGEHPLTGYLAPLFLYYIISAAGIPLFFQQFKSQILVIAGSFIWAFLMIMLTALLVRLNIRIKI